MVVFQKPRRAKNISIFGEKLSLESIIMSYTPQNLNSSSYWSMTLSSHCKYFALGLGQSWSFLGWGEMENHSLVIRRLNPSGKMNDFVIWENREGLVQKGPKIYVPCAWSCVTRVSAPGSSSEEEPLVGQDDEAIWVEVGSLAKASRALTDYWILSANCCGESTNKWMEELSELDDEEVLDGVWIAELLAFF